MVGRTLALATGLVAAVAGSQVPEFAQQYRQRLGGTIDELRLAVERFDQDARNSGLTREQALNRLQAGPDPFVRRRGESEVVAETRLDRLEKHRDAMREAGPFMRVGTFLAYGDAELTGRTFKDFEPAMPVTSEGAVGAGAGFIAGYGFIRLVLAPFRRRKVAKPAVGR